MEAHFRERVSVYEYFFAFAFHIITLNGKRLAPFGVEASFDHKKRVAGTEGILVGAESACGTKELDGFKDIGFAYAVPPREATDAVRYVPLQAFITAEGG
jgi:hypothetical protein